MFSKLFFDFKNALRLGSTGLGFVFGVEELGLYFGPGIVWDDDQRSVQREDGSLCDFVDGVPNRYQFIYP
jgi:hypothetical protein